MLQRTAYKSRAWMAAICILAGVLVLSVFPMRLWRRTVTFEGTGKPLVMSDAVDTNSVVSQVFVAQYDRLGSIDVFVGEITGGRYMDMELQSSEGVILCRRIVDMAEFETPGYVRMEAGINLRVGFQYRLYLRGKQASFRLGLEPVAANPVPYMGAFFREYTPDASLRLQMAANYDVPIAKGLSLLLIAACCAVAYGFCIALRAWSRKHPERDRLLLVSVMVERALYVAAAVFYLVLFVLNFPLKRFNDRPGEILFLALGIVLAAAFTFYAIRRFCTEHASGEKTAVKDRVAAVFMALAIAYGCEYMNGVYNLMHSASERQMLACILAVIVLSFRTDMLVNRFNLLWLFVSGGGAAWYVLRYALHANTADDVLRNTVMRFDALNVILGGIIVNTAVRSIHAKVWKRQRLSRFGLLTAALLLCLILFGGTRQMGIILLLVSATLYVCVCCNIPAARFMRIVVRGVNINFLLTVGYCLLFRAYQAYIFTRYGMVFHTVAVTGEYLASVTLFAAVQLLTRLSKAEENETARTALRRSWKELLLFALAGVYALFTVSRTAYLAIATGVFVLVVVYAAAWASKAHTGRFGFFFKRCALSFAAMICSSVLLFPGVFALQRILPAMNGRHQVITSVEENIMTHELLGKTRWDSTFYISGLRFWSLFRSRILRKPEIVFFFAEDRYNYGEDYNLLYDEKGMPKEPKESDMEPEEIPAFAEVTDGTGESSVEISNGRMDIFRTYISRLDMQGHGVLATEDPHYIHAHNSYLQVMYTNGIPTGLLFTFWVACATVLPLALYRRNVKKYGNTEGDADLYLAVAAAPLAFATAAMTEMNFQLCNPMCFLLFTGILPLIFRKEEPACCSDAD